MKILTFTHECVVGIKREKASLPTTWMLSKPDHSLDNNILMVSCTFMLFLYLAFLNKEICELLNKVNLKQCTL